MLKLNTKIVLLDTPRLSLRSLTPDIYRELFTLCPEEKIAAFLGKGWQQERTKFQNGMTTYRTSFFNFQLIDKTDGQIIGSCGYHTWYLQHDRAEIGYALTDQEKWNRGFMKEALGPVIAYGFNMLHLHRIEAMVGPGNAASQKLVRAFGFKEEGLMREHYIKNGIAEHSQIFSLLHQEYRQLQNTSVHA